MKKMIVVCAILLVIGLAISVLFVIKNKNTVQLTNPGSEFKVSEPKLEVVENVKMKISSPEFKNNQEVPSKYTCDGEDVNPPLVFEDVPDLAQSLVLIVDDPDAPSKTWVHWVVFNISPETTEIDEDSIPDEALLGTTDFGNKSYGGPCPPSGEHRYFFKLYALNTTLDLQSGATKEDVESAMRDHIIDQAELVGLYSR